MRQPRCSSRAIAAFTLLLPWVARAAGEDAALVMGTRAMPIVSETPVAVPTFECLGLTWSTPEGKGAPPRPCAVEYRAGVTDAWHKALDLWRDDRGVDGLPGQYRGSIVNLRPGTTYDVRLSIGDGSRATIQATTWSGAFPIGATQAVASITGGALTITNGGTACGYVLYTHPAGGTAVVDAANVQDCCVEVRASHVIVRGLTLRGASVHGIVIAPGVKNVVIEDCDISGWGQTSVRSGYGVDGQSAIWGRGAGIARLVIQRNRIHDPRSGANNWDQLNADAEPPNLHPRGPQGITLFDTAGNHVIRYNDIRSGPDHFYNDGIGGGSNFSYAGSPNRDSDIYGNIVQNCYDDAIESEGANCNVRIWGNRLDHTFVAVAIAAVSIGPIYVWRNVVGEVSRNPEADTDITRVGLGAFLKTGDGKGRVDGHGRVYVFHNTLLQPHPPAGKTLSIGCQTALGHGGPLANVRSRNNILHTRLSSKWATIHGSNDPDCSHDHDLYNSTLTDCLAPVEPHGILGYPVYAGDPFRGELALATNSPGYDAGAILPNFNDGFTGAGPDLGAQEAGTPGACFGIAAPVEAGIPAPPHIKE